ncbi:MAG: glycosyltransferase family 39 protein [Anaerolineae bacterium]|nr:glycosyltransferase family 39 protein [Anaerolineae bacterium]
MRKTERQLILMLLLLSAALGMAHAIIVPTWSQVEEPGHFEYIRTLIVHREMPDPDNPDLDIRREIISTYIWAHHRLGSGGRMANQLLIDTLGLKTDADWIDLRDRLQEESGYASPGDVDRYINRFNSQLKEPPGYYLIAASVLFPFRNATLETQLLIARLFTVGLGVLTIWLAYLTACELFPNDRLMRIAIPAVVALLPSFVVLTATVNNTVAAAAAVSLAIYASVRLVRRGYSPWGLALLMMGVAACMVSKTTAYAGLPVMLLAVPLARRKAWPRWILYVALGLAGIGAVLGLRWHRPASWYRVDFDNGTQQVGDAPEGSRVFEQTANDSNASMWQSLPGSTVKELRGQLVTLGAWMRADREQTLDNPPSLLYAPDRGNPERIPWADEPVTVDEEWKFYATTVTIPEDAQCMVYQMLAPGEYLGEYTIQYDGVIMAAGEWPLDEAPLYENRAASRGTWGGKAFENLLLNASSERGIPLIRSDLVTLLPERLADTGVKLNPRIATLMDWKANREIFSQSMRWLFTSFWSRYGWSLPGLPRWIVLGLFGLSIVSGAGLVVYGIRAYPEAPLWQRRAMVLLLIDAGLSVGLAVFRIDPIQMPLYCDFYQGRFISTGYYIIPGALPLMAVWYLGLRQWVPERGQRWLLAVTVMGLFLLSMGVLFGRQIPDYLAVYGIDPPLTPLMQLWGWSAW